MRHGAMAAVVMVCLGIPVAARADAPEISWRTAVAVVINRRGDVERFDVIRDTPEGCEEARDAILQHGALAAAIGGIRARKITATPCERVAVLTEEEIEWVGAALLESGICEVAQP